ncbi:MAG: DNA polymerase III subunit gamma/tau [bacterium]|nr:DNA polymerase III subunit gamma/tau [bacterium]
MSNIVLYRKYRPSNFTEVVGQEHIVATLRHAAKSNLLSHAYLFAGPRGSGKTTIARIVAKAANCSNLQDGDPCDACDFCREIKENKTVDVIEIDAASNRGIDEMRDLKESIRFAPTSLKERVFIIDEAHQLTKEAANALLKTLEEPPPRTMFILATTEVHKMIPTILSRCQRFDFRKIPVADIVSRLTQILKKEKAKANPSALHLIATRSGGSFRDAETLLERILTYHLGNKEEGSIETETVQELLGIINNQLFEDITSLLATENAAGALELLDNHLLQGMDPFEFVRQLISYLRSLMILQVNPNLKESVLLEYLTPEQKEKALEQSREFPALRLREALEKFTRAEQEMKYASILQLPLEIAIADICRVGEEKLP